MENTMNLKDFGKALGKNEIPDTQKGPSVNELTAPILEEKKEEIVKTTETVVTPTRKVEVFDMSDAKDMTLSMQRTAQERANDRGIVPNLDDDEIKKMEDALNVGLEDYMAYTEKDRNEAVEVLRRHGYSDEEIDEIPLLKLLDIARAVKADEAEGTVGDMKHVVQEDGTIKEESINDVTNNKIDDTQAVNTAVKTEVKPTEPVPPTSGEQVKPTVIDNRR